jgi:uncharacterized protein (DUF427 family)
MKAKWNNIIIAESNDTQLVEGNHYFPRNSISIEYYNESETHTTCGWKGEASYFDIIIGDEVNKDAAWYYPDPKDAAKNIKNMIAFWKGVEIIE